MTNLPGPSVPSVASAAAVSIPAVHSQRADGDTRRGKQGRSTRVSGVHVFEKTYRPSSSWPRLALECLARGKTGSGVRSRHRTERDVLAVWRRHGFDVPRDMTSPGQSRGRRPVAIFEYVSGSLLGRDLALQALNESTRSRLLRQFAAEWSRRHALALELREPRLIHEHGSFNHVIVAGERLVTIDFEQTYLPTADLRRIVSKEIVSYLRGLYKWLPRERFERDLAIILEAYPRRDLLIAAARAYLDPDSLFWKVVWSVDRRRNPRKYRVITSLVESLAS